MRSLLKKLLSIAFLLFFVTACNDNDSWCEGSASDAYDDVDSIKQVKQTTLKINSVSAEIQDDSYTASEMEKYYGKWVDSGFSVREGDEFEINATGQIVIADDYYTDTDNGLGKKYVIPANKNNPTLIPDFEFVKSQQVTVTTEDCTKGSRSYCNPSQDATCEPTKWTWNTAWKYTVAKCVYNDVWDQLFDYEDKSCYAYKCCSKWLGVCWEYKKWECYHDEGSEKGAYSKSGHDVCPTNTDANGKTYTTKAEYPYICDSNVGAEKYCFPDTDPPYLPEEGSAADDCCDGCGNDASGSHPGCSDTSSSEEHSSRTFNTCGYVDSCWGTGGYGLYATEEGTQCTPGCDDVADAEIQCPPGCTHLSGSYEKFDETHGDNSLEAGDFVGGTSFSYVGEYTGASGYLYLQIINPLASPTDTTTELQDEIKSLQDENALLETEITDLRAELDPQLRLINDYSDDSDNLGDDTTTLNEGIIGEPDVPENQPLKDQLSDIEFLFDDPGTQIIDPATNKVTSTTYGMDVTFDKYSADIDRYLNGYSNTYYNENEEEVTEDIASYIDKSWVSTAGTLKQLAIDINDATQNLPIEIFGEGSITTSENITTHKTNVNAIMPQLAIEIDYAISLQEDIDQKETTIEVNNSKIDDLNEEIYEATSYDENNDLIGGYTVYVKAGGLVGDNGQHLCAVISDSDPNDPENQDKVTELFCNGYTKMTYAVTMTMAASGNIWLKIEDPDLRYDNNSQYYNVVMGKVTYTSGFSSMLTDLINLIKNTVMETSERIYKGLTCSDDQENKTSICIEFTKIITALLYLYVIIFGMMYLFGLIKHNQVDFVLRIVKMATVIALIQPGSFEFFNTYLFDAFFGFSDTLIAYATGAPVENPFDFISLNMNVLILDEATYFKIIGMIFQGLMGLVVFALLVHGVVAFVCAFFNAFLVYMVSFVGLGLCFATAPIFLTFLLFNKTAYLFENWFKLMVKYTIQPVILLVGLIIINGMLTAIIESIFNYYVCFKCTMPFTFALPGYPEVGTTTLFCISWFSAWGADNVDSPMGKALMSLPLAISFCLVTSAMKVFADKLAGDVASQITGSSSMTKSGGSSMGLNPLKGMDNQAFSLGRNLGLAGNRKEYEALRNKTLGKSLKLTVGLQAMGSPTAAAVVASKILHNLRKKDLDPESLKNEDNKNN